MIGALAVVLVLGGLIFFHELGHFLIARLFGVGVKTFSLGFGPKVLSFKRGLTEYQLSAVPLGGYVNMVGEQPGAEMPEEFSREHSFTGKPAWQRMLIVAAGPVFNFLLAFLIYWFLFTAHGQHILIPGVGDIKADSPAMQAGLQKGDIIRSIDGQDISDWEQMVDLIGESGGRTLRLEIDRNGTLLAKSLTPEVMVRKNIFGEEIHVPMIGVVASGEVRNVPLGAGSAFVHAFRQTGEVVYLTFQGIVKMIERIIPMENLGGPIMIAQMVSQQADVGFANVLALAAVISINLGILNLLPIPVLDGGHILFFLIESIIRRPVSPRLQAATIKVGMGLLLTLMTFAIYNDLKRLFTE